MTGVFGGMIADVSGGALNLKILKGDTIDRTLLFKQSTESTAAALNLTGYKARAQFRRANVSTVLLDFSSTASPATITINSTAGSVRLTQTAATTAALPIGEGVWDLKLVLISSGTVSTVASGGFRIVETTTIA